MDAATVVALAGMAGSALVTAMVTDSWNTVKPRFTRILSRRAEQREEASDQQLEASRAAVLALPAAEAEAGSRRAAAKWAQVLEEAIHEDPALVDEIRDLVTEIHEHTSADTGRPAVVQNVSAGRDSYAAGNNQYFGPRAGRD